METVKFSLTFILGEPLLKNSLYATVPRLNENPGYATASVKCMHLFTIWNG